MQDLSAKMETALAMRTASNTLTINRRPVWLYEIYPHDYYPAEDGDFDPTDAVALFSEISFTWLGHAYRRQVESRAPIQRFFDQNVNDVSITFVNSDLYMSSFVIANNVEGMRLVIRYIDAATVSPTLADSVVAFVGRLESPSKLDEETCELSATQELGSLNVECPKRTFSATDPDGRSPTDPLFHGFKFAPVTGTYQYPTTVTKRKFFFFIKQVTVMANAQWSSQDNINEGDVIPIILGRAQMELAPVLWADIGTEVKGLWVAAGSKISDMVNIVSRTAGFYLREITKHLGDPGGTGTNASSDPQFPNAGYLSDTAYVGAKAPGSKAENVDSAPNVTAILLGEHDLPDGSGGWTLRGPTSNPAYLARYVLTSPDFLKLDGALIHNATLLATAADCDEEILDLSNAESLVLDAIDAAKVTTGETPKLNSTGLIISATFESQLTTNYEYPQLTAKQKSQIISTSTGGGGEYDPPQVVSLTGSGSTVVITFDKELQAGSLNTSHFTVKKNAVPQTVNSAVASNSIVTLTLGASFTVQDVLTVAYTGDSIVGTNLIAAATFGSAFVTIGGQTPVPGTPVFPTMIHVRKRYTYNAPIVEKIAALDLLLKSLFPSARFYMLTGSDGRLRIRTEKPADSSYVFANATAGAGTIKVNNVEPWIASKKGYVLIGVGTTSSEVKTVTDATYDPTFGNSATLALAATGTAGIAGPSSFSGGTTTVPASAQVTLSGTGDVRHPAWQNVQGAKKQPLSGLRSNKYADGWGDCGAATSRTATLSEDSEFEFNVDGVTVVAGFTYSTNPLNYTEICYGIQVNQVNNEISMVIGGEAPAASTGRKWSYGDRFKVTKTGAGHNEFKAYHNGALINTASPAQYATGTVRGAFVGFGSQAAISDVTMSPYPVGAINEGEVITITINGIPVRYIVSETDTVEAVAGILAAYVNASWAVRSYVRAWWDVDNPTKVTLYIKEGILTLDTNLANDQPASLTSPTNAPTLAAAASGSLTAGDYTLAYAYESAMGRTFVGPAATVNLTAGQKITVTGPTSGSWPTGTTALAWYMSKAAGDPTMAFLVSNAGGTFTVNVLPDPAAAAVPVDNNSGRETIRVMHNFTAENILRGKFQWPLVNNDKAINQVLIKYREASMDFGARELYINDYEHQHQINKTNTMEIDGTGIDNFNQAWRLANTALSKEREGNFFCEWQTDEAGIKFEEGDVVCATDTSGGFINIPLRIEKLVIEDDGNVSFRARLYSTIMFSDDVGKHSITIPSALKYFNVVPPDVSNVVLTEGHLTTSTQTWVSTIHGEFDFGEYLGGQIARVYVKYEGTSDYVLVENVIPSPENHGSFDVVGPPLTTGTGHEVKIVTENQFGYTNGLTNATVYQVEILGPPPMADPSNLTAYFDEVSGDALIEWVNNNTLDADSQEVNELQLRDEADTEWKRTIPIKPSILRPLQEYVVWGSLPTGWVGVADGGMDTVGVGLSCESATTADALGGLLIEFQAADDGSPPPTYMSIFPTDSYGYSGDYAYMWQCYDRSGPPYYDHVDQWWMYPENRYGGDQDPYAQRLVPGNRYGVYIRPDGIAEYHINYTPSSRPVFISGRVVNYSVPYRAYLGEWGGSGKIRRVSWQRYGPEWKYTAAAQKKDNGGVLPDSFKARVRQLSPWVNGRSSNWVQTTFTRP